MFLTKKFKENNQCYNPETFLNAMIKKIKLKNILNIIEFQNLWNLINVFIKKYLWKYFLWFFKVWWVQENQGVMFLVISLKDGLAQNLFIL